MAPKASTRGNRTFPFAPRSTARLWPGDYWGIRLGSGQFGCAVVTDVARSGPASRSAFVAGLLDWSGDKLPTAADASAGRIFTQGLVVIGVFTETGAEVLGNVALPPDLEIPANLRGPAKAGDVLHVWGWKAPAAVIERRLAGGLR